VTIFSGYVDPVVSAVVRAERIDQGVDYAGTGFLTAIGPARLTYIGTSNTGWPGSFVEYQPLAGPDAGCDVFYAEGLVPAPRLRAGQTISAGQRLATIIPGYPTGIELGWGVGTGTTTYAAKTTGWSPDDDKQHRDHSRQALLGADRIARRLTGDRRRVAHSRTATAPGPEQGLRQPADQALSWKPTNVRGVSTSPRV
jgi:hypothetical protein